MNKHLMYSVALALSVAFTACATQYQSPGGTGGYADRQTDANTYNIAFSGNGSTSSDRIDKSLLYQCAGLTVVAGLRLFCYESHVD